MNIEEGNHEELRALQKKHNDSCEGAEDSHYKLVFGWMGILLLFVVAVFFTQPLPLCIGAVVFAIGIYFPVIVLCLANENPYVDEETHQQFRRLHGCEHAMMQVLSKEEEATLENLKRKSILNAECGTVYCGYAIMLVTILALVIANIAALGILKSLCIVGATIVLIVICIFLPYNPFMVLQKPAVANPTEREYVLGVAILNKFNEL